MLLVGTFSLLVIFASVYNEIDRRTFLDLNTNPTNWLMRCAQKETKKKNVCNVGTCRWREASSDYVNDVSNCAYGLVFLLW